jgi:hypothetical protein
MGWQDLLSSADDERTLPWTGGKQVHDRERTWTIQGKLPVEHGWNVFRISGGRKAELKGPADPDPDFTTGHKVVKGYLVGDRIIPDDARVDPDPAKLIDQTFPVFLVELGLERFARASVAQTRSGLVYIAQEFPQGSETEVQMAYQDRKDSVAHVAGVTPALDLAFRWVSYQRLAAEEREREMERIRVEEERKQVEAERLKQAMKDAGTGAGRRALAQRDFSAAAKAALKLTGAELLDARQSYNKREMVVQYRFQNRRLECVVDKDTLRVVDSGICLQDHHTGVKGDTRFTLESLPTVVGEAIRTGKLVVYRHVDGDRGYDDDWDD